MTFFDPAGSSAPIDLQVPETFHRLKRTLLLLCSVLIVLGLAKGAETRELKLTMVDVSLHIEIIRSLLWLAAVYYLAGFAMEVRIVRLINSEAMLGAGMKTVEGAFGKIATNIAAAQSTIDQSVKTATERLQSMLEASVFENPMSKFMRELADPSSLHADPNLSSRMMDLEHRLSNAIREQDEQNRRIESTAMLMSNAVRDYEQRRASFAHMLSHLEKDFGRLSRRIHGDRRLSFWAWEIGGALGAFAIATVINAGHLFRNAADAMWTVLIALNLV
jgi:hypothetical protein